MEFQKAYELQQQYLEISKNQNHIFVLGLEHPEVITLGYRADAENEIVNSSRIEVVKIKRGGFATLHSPGQLVIYPILNLRAMGMGVREYIYLLLNTTAELLKNLGIQTYIDDSALGLYTSTGKIAFCGIQVSHGISQHGLSLNVHNELSLFSNIRSCGVSGAKFDSVKTELGLKALFDRWITIFNLRLDRQELAETVLARD